ncbi:MAG: phospholipid/cholesterol/gamma-HCH transport system substrate-binding protein [Solirubrobacteraceae bacterium]|jgi:virulence factor Mce-like protein|nr:phospholipid/cholesterol/gamma-HCH transport system substrate-binding protein [Solirubrobacteraceae bacterium]
MQKQAPSFGRILTMVLFALSCFGLLLFLWLSFGGAIPAKPQGYRFKIAFPEATQLGLEADVRVAGVRVGKVRGKDLAPHGNRTLATIELDRRFAPVHTDARAILRQKTLLGETYVELTPGTKNSPTVKEGGTLHNSQVAPTVQLDEIFTAFDPTTREAFRVWQQSLAGSFRGRGQDLSDSLGHLPGLASDASILLRILDEENAPLRRLVHDTGDVFAALTQDEGALSGLITHSEQVFSATASQNDALAATFQIFPTFLDESKATLADLRRFSVNTRPLIADLRPAMRDLRPAVHDLRLLAPDLRTLFRRLDPLITASKAGLPALRDTLKGAKPLLAANAPFLGELNPILDFFGLYSHQVSDFLGNAASGLASNVPTATSGSPGHILRQLSPFGSESVAIHKNRVETNRGNTYLEPLALSAPITAQSNMFPNWDCVNNGGDKPIRPGTQPGSSIPACFTQKPLFFQGRTQGRFPHVDAETYAGP